MKKIILLLIYLANSVVWAQSDDISPSIINEVKSSIYKLYAIEKDKETVIAVGSGVAISKHYIATNCHIAFAGNFLIVNDNGSPRLARLCYFNKGQDLCIIDVPSINLHPVAIRDSKTVAKGETVFAIGYPGGNNEVVSKGIVKDALRGSTLEVLIKTSHGSSGGGLFDKDGKLIGITSGGIEDRGTSYALATSLILDVISPHNHPKCSVPEF